MSDEYDAVTFSEHNQRKKMDRLVKISLTLAKIDTLPLNETNRARKKESIEKEMLDIRAWTFRCEEYHKTQGEILEKETAPDGTWHNDPWDEKQVRRWNHDQLLQIEVQNWKQFLGRDFEIWGFGGDRGEESKGKQKLPFIAFKPIEFRKEFDKLLEYSQLDTFTVYEVEK